MRRIKQILILSCFFSTVSIAQEPTPADTLLLPELTKKAHDIVTLISSSNYAELAPMFDVSMAAALPEDKFHESWKMIQDQVGAFQRQGNVRIERVTQYDIVYVTCQFQRASLDIRMIFDSQGQIAGLLYMPSETATNFVSAYYVNKDTFQTHDITIGTGEWALPATLTIPNGSDAVPAIALVHGSGPNDRDETVGPNKPFRDLAEGLATKGIAVLRYEKRTKQYPEKVIAMIDSLTVKEETVDDAIEAVKALKQTPGIGKVFVLGHSFGGTMIPRIAKGSMEIDGFIILAGMAKPLENTIQEQFNYIYLLDGVISPEEKAELDTLDIKVAKVKTTDLSVSTPRNELPLGMPASYWLDLRGYEPAVAARDIYRPMLFLQGARDYQVTKVDFEIWKNNLSSRKDVEFKLYPSLNHLFIEGEGKITPDEYGVFGHVSEEVINDIAAWVKSH